MSLRILLVEDNPENRDMLGRRLSRRGHQVTFAMDGAEAVVRVQTDRPDIVLMDLSLPVMDGWEATRTIKADAAIGAIPVIALTAHAMAGDRERAIAAGADDYDTKPVDLERLLSKIAALTSQHH
jgi:CheY-like chemotaxis protein